MPFVKLTADSFNDHIANNKIVLVDFWAPWCAPCKNFMPILGQAALKHPEISFAKINVDENRHVAEQYGLHSIPHLILFKNQTIMYNKSGPLTEKALDDLIQMALDS